jgi:hypothetical protein
MAAGSALRLRLHDEQEHESEKQDTFLLER